MRAAYLTDAHLWSHDPHEYRRGLPQPAGRLHDNTFALRKGGPLGERLGTVARERGILLMLCDQCAAARGLAEKHEGGGHRPKDVVEGFQVGCFPDLYAALGTVPELQVISL